MMQHGYLAYPNQTSYQVCYFTLNEENVISLYF